jgi:hypothetical protein
MNDKVKAQTQEMSRDQLVRAEFEAYRDLEWAKNLEPKFRRYHLDSEELRHYREAWNARTENRDWEWWQDHVKGWSNEKLMAEINECMQEIKALQMRQSAHEPTQGVGRTFLQILSADDGMPSPEPGQTTIRLKER